MSKQERFEQLKRSLKSEMGSSEADMLDDLLKLQAGGTKMKKEVWKTIGHVGVDSGSLMIGDPCYLDDADDWNPELYKKWICGELCNAGPKQAVEINEMCLNQAVAFSSGFGDGVYPVQALYQDYGTNGHKDMRIKEVRILLIQDDNELDNAEGR